MGRPRQAAVDFHHEPAVGYGDTTAESRSEFVLDRVASRAEHIRKIRATLDESVRALLPFLETEVRGTEMLGRAAEILFA